MYNLIAFNQAKRKKTLKFTYAYSFDFHKEKRKNINTNSEGNEKGRANIRLFLQEEKKALLCKCFRLYICKV